MKMNKIIPNLLKVAKKNPIAYGLRNGFPDLLDIHNDWLKLFLWSKDDMTLKHTGVVIRLLAYQ